MWQECFKEEELMLRENAREKHTTETVVDWFPISNTIKIRPGKRETEYLGFVDFM